MYHAPQASGNVVKIATTSSTSLPANSERISMTGSEPRYSTPKVVADAVHSFQIQGSPAFPPILMVKFCATAESLTKSLLPEGNPIDN